MVVTESTELEKMLNGDMYDAADPVLVQMRKDAKILCFELNQTSPANPEKRQEITQKMLGVDDANGKSDLMGYWRVFERNSWCGLRNYDRE